MSKKLFLITIFSSVASMAVIFASCDLFSSNEKVGGDITVSSSASGTICQTDSGCQNGQVCNTATGYCGARNTTPAGAVIFLGDNTGTCPDGYADNGIIGLLSNNVRVLSNYTLGGHLDTAWTWTHPKMCISTGSATSYSTNSVAFVVATADCPARSTEVGQTGIIWKSSSPYFYEQGDQLINDDGVTLNPDWWWTNPLICTNDTASSPTVKGSIVFANTTGTCPSGYTEKGKIGIIKFSSVGCGAFESGAPTGADWQWCHPFLCVKN